MDGLIPENVVLNRIKVAINSVNKGISPIAKESFVKEGSVVLVRIKIANSEHILPITGNEFARATF